MKKHILIPILALLFANTFQAQTRGTKIGYIDMEYILQNVPDYKEAQNQLEQKAIKWKQEIEIKKNEIDKLKAALKAEKALLTKGLIEERNAEITFLENENLDYQQKKFGPYGDLMTQKAGLTKPIQDQVFTAIQDIAEAKKYDFIFDKTSDLTMLFAAKRYDISDQIIRVLNRAEKREQLTKKQLKEEEAKELKLDAIDDNPALANRQKALDDKKLAREKAIADRLLLQEEKKKEAEDRRAQILADREAKISGTTTTTQKTAVTTASETDKEDTKAAAAEARQKQLDERAKVIEERKKAAEDRRAQILADREAKISEANASQKTTSPTPAIEANKEDAKTAAAEAKQKQLDERAKILEDRKKLIEDNKKAAEEKRAQIIKDNEAKKISTPATTTTKTSTTTNKTAEPVKTGTVSESTLIKVETPTEDTVVKDSINANTKTPAEIAREEILEKRAQILEERKKTIEENKKALEEKRKKILQDREDAKKIKE